MAQETSTEINLQIQSLKQIEIRFLIFPAETEIFTFKYDDLSLPSLPLPNFP